MITERHFPTLETPNEMQKKQRQPHCLEYAWIFKYRNALIYLQLLHFEEKDQIIVKVMMNAKEACKLFEY